MCPRLLLGLISLTALLTTVGCFNPDYGQGGFSCYDDECPEGYICIQEQDGPICRPEGTSPPETDAGVPEKDMAEPEKDIGPQEDGPVEPPPPCSEPELLGPLPFGTVRPFGLVINENESWLSVVHLDDENNPRHFFRNLQPTDSGNPPPWETNSKLNSVKANHMALAADHMNRVHLFFIDDGMQAIHMLFEGHPSSPWQEPGPVMFNLAQVVPDSDMEIVESLDAHGFKDHLALVVTGTYKDINTTGIMGPVAAYSRVHWDETAGHYHYDVTCAFAHPPGAELSVNGPRVRVGPQSVAASYFVQEANNNTEWHVATFPRDSSVTGEFCGPVFSTGRPGFANPGDMAVASWDQNVFAAFVESSIPEPGPLLFAKWGPDAPPTIDSWQHLDPNAAVKVPSVHMITDKKNQPVISYIAKHPEPPQTRVSLSLLLADSWEHVTVAPGGYSKTMMLQEDTGRLHLLFDNNEQQKRVLKYVTCTPPQP